MQYGAAGAMLNKLSIRQVYNIFLASVGENAKQRGKVETAKEVEERTERLFSNMRVGKR